MKNTLLSLILCLCSISTLYSQEISLKYGKVTNDELNMKVYPKDSTAEAAVLYDDGYTIYTYSSSTGFIIESSFKKKIKILKQEGIDYASVSIPYYFTSNSKSDLITGLEAIAYNFENGKIVKTKLEKDYIFTEEINSRYKQVKFLSQTLKWEQSSNISTRCSLLSRMICPTGISKKTYPCLTADTRWLFLNTSFSTQI